jgi:prepilin-type N-terminal cleavage/methylation domain-containing protein
MKKGFTLIELLVVIAILAVLAVVVVLTLNPAGLLQEGRDSSRISDMATLNTGINLSLADGNTAIGSANTIYVSLPDLTATSTAGDQCQGLGLLSLPSGYSYQCAASSTYRLTNGTGWVPVNFTQASFGAPFSRLPTDPVNASSSRLYYTYETDGNGHYEVTSVMESAKYQLGGTGDVISTDGGTLASVYEKGSRLGMEPLDYGDPSLVGLWTFDEGTGSVAYDYSGNNATGNWVGTLGNQWGAGRIGSGAGMFNGTTTYLYAAYNVALHPINKLSITAWIKKPSGSYGSGIVIVRTANDYYLDFANSTACLRFGVNSNWGSESCGYPDDGNWHFVAGTYDGAVINRYVDGVLLGQTTYSGAIGNAGGNLDIGSYAGQGPPYIGPIDDVRIYNRALSAAQIAAMYAGGK